MFKLEDVLNGLYGLAIGDALGVPYEFKDRDTFRCTDMVGYGTYNQPKGTWSDDTSLVLATMDAMVQGFDLDYIMQLFSMWYTYGVYTPAGITFDIGITTKKAIEKYMRGIPTHLCGDKDEFENGNGSLMRMLPMIYYSDANSELDVNKIFDLSAITHAHVISKICCLYYVIIGREILSQKGERDLKHIIVDAINKIENLDKFILDAFHTSHTPEMTVSRLRPEYLIDTLCKSRDEIKSSGFVIDSLEAALWCLYNTDNYKDCVLTAVNLGSDTDTIAAIAGGLAGIYYGLSDIPSKWVDNLENKQLLENIARRFYRGANFNIY